MSVQLNPPPLALVCLVALFAGLASSCLRCDDSCEQASMSWDDYKSLFNKSYSLEEDARRGELFQKEQMRVIEHNSDPLKTYELGIDFMSDWNNTEFERTMGPHFPRAKTLWGYEDEDQHEDEDCNEDDDSGCGCDCDEDEDEDEDGDDDDECDEEFGNLDPFVAEIVKRHDPVPCSVDWRRTPNRVGRVKFQLGCGACWAFATTGLLEGQQVARNFTSSLVELSEQQLVDCKQGGNGCGGWFSDEALNQIAKDGGIMSEKDYPYALNGTTKCRFDAKKSVMKVKGFAKLPEDDEETLATVVARYGPVAISMDLKPLRGYRSGIITINECDCSHKANHEALIVGYGSENDIDYWLVKNSWSAEWGDAGYFKIERGEGVCGISKEPIIATF